MNTLAIPECIAHSDANHLATLRLGKDDATQRNATATQ